MIYKLLLHIKLKIEQYEFRCSGRVSSSCSTSGTHHVTYSSYKPGDVMKEVKEPESVYNKWKSS